MKLFNRDTQHRKRNYKTKSFIDGNLMKRFQQQSVLNDKEK